MRPSDAAVCGNVALPRRALSAFLRTLWNVEPALLAVPAPAALDEFTNPYLSPAGLHLPAHHTAERHWYRAAAAHAAAHLVYSRQPFERSGLAPVTQALIGVLEDARVEWLACRELPGLRALWLVHHAAPEEHGEGFEALMRRLARSLLQPQCSDPHPWVQKGRGLFFTDGAAQALALRQPGDLRQAASRLGNDIGQMRLPFNPRLYAPEPSYRDDNRALWRADPPEPVAPEPAASTPQPDSTEPPAEAPLTMSVRARHPEWDWLIARYRNDWCTVLDTPAPDSADTGLPTALPPDPSLVRRLRCTLQRSRDTRTLARDGEQIDLDALLRWAIATRSGRAGDERVHRQRQRGADRSALLLSLDLSASSGERVAEGLASVLDAASAAASALQATVGTCAIDGFHSNGRHEVHYERIKGFDTPLAPNALVGLRSGGSTRLGAALRHATATLAGRHGGRRTLLVLTDGQAHDVDVHDPRYLIEDARRAVREAAQQGVLTVCITLGSQGEPSAQRIFGAKHCRSLRQVERLPRAIAQLGL